MYSLIGDGVAWFLIVAASETANARFLDLDLMPRPPAVEIDDDDALDFSYHTHKRSSGSPPKIVPPPSPPPPTSLHAIKLQAQKTNVVMKE